QDPALLAVVPVFRDPVVDELALLEVGAEAATRPRRDSLPAQHSDVEQRDMPADADHALAGWACLRQRPAVLAGDAVEHLLDAAHVGLGMLLGRKGDARGRGVSV